MLFDYLKVWQRQHVILIGYALGADVLRFMIALELDRLKGMKVLCLYGKEEIDTICPTLQGENSPFKVFPLNGGHHFDGDFKKLAELIFSEAAAR